MIGDYWPLLLGLAIVAAAVAFKRYRENQAVGSGGSFTRTLSAEERAQLAGLEFLNASRNLGDVRFVRSHADTLSNHWAEGIRKAHTDAVAPAPKDRDGSGA